VQRFDLDQAGAVLLLGQVAVRGRDAAARSVSISVRPADATTPALVAAMSSAVGQMADALAGMLVAG
jgi:uncharacterized lipoprotein YmbA